MSTLGVVCRAYEFSPLAHSALLLIYYNQAIYSHNYYATRNGIDGLIYEISNIIGWIGGKRYKLFHFISNTIRSDNEAQCHWLLSVIDHVPWRTFSSISFVILFRNISYTVVWSRDSSKPKNNASFLQYFFRVEETLRGCIIYTHTHSR